MSWFGLSRLEQTVGYLGALIVSCDVVKRLGRSPIMPSDADMAPLTFPFARLPHASGGVVRYLVLCLSEREGV